MEHTAALLKGHGSMGQAAAVLQGQGTYGAAHCSAPTGPRYVWTNCSTPKWPWLCETGRSTPTGPRYVWTNCSTPTGPRSVWDRSQNSYKAKARIGQLAALLQGHGSSGTGRSTPIGPITSEADRSTSIEPRNVYDRLLRSYMARICLGDTASLGYASSRPQH